MNRYCRLHFAVSILLMMTALASAQPQPLTIQGPQAEGTPVFIRGFGFGPSPADAVPAGVSGSLDGLQSCVVLTDGPAPGPDVWLEVQDPLYWREDVVAFHLTRNWPAGTKCLFLILVDDRGVSSVPVGPVTIVDGRAQLGGVETALEDVAADVGDGGLVSLLRLEGGKSDLDCSRIDISEEFNSPGQAGQPKVANWSP